MKRKRGKDLEIERLVDIFKEELDSAPEPNEGRIKELKDQIKEGTLVTPEAIRVSAQRILEKFLGRN